LKKKVKLLAFAELFLNVPPANKWNQLIKTSQLVVRWLLFYETKVILILQVLTCKLTPVYVPENGQGKIGSRGLRSDVLNTN
jgi:hypothetical protein